jgi:hypothetical protein
VEESSLLQPLASKISAKSTIDINFISNRDIVAENSDIFKTCPSSHRAVPPDDRALHPCMILDAGAVEQYTSLKSNTITNHAIRTDCDIGTDATILANFGTGIDEHIPAIHKGLLC